MLKYLKKKQIQTLNSALLKKDRLASSPSLQRFGVFINKNPLATNQALYSQFFNKVLIGPLYKKNQIRFVASSNFFQRTRLHLNFRSFFVENYKLMPKVVEPKRYSRYTKRFKSKIGKTKKLQHKQYVNLVLQKKKFLSFQLKFLQVKQKWKQALKTRNLLVTGGFRFRQRLVAHVSYLRFFFRYHPHYYPKKLRTWKRFRFFLNFRRKTLKYEKKKNNLIQLNAKLNYQTMRVRYRLQKRFAIKGHKRRLRKALFYRRRVQAYLRDYYGFTSFNQKSGNSPLVKPFWFRKNFKQWRVRKMSAPRVYQNKLNQHYANLVSLKQGLRYYYGSFRLSFLQKIYYQLKSQKKEADLAQFITYLETCLFVVLYRANLVSHPKLAVYLMRDQHKIFYLNGRFINHPLYRVKRYDFIGIKNRVYRKMLNRFLRVRLVPAFVYMRHLLGFGWVVRVPEVRDNKYLSVLPLNSLRYLVSNLKYLL